MKINIIGGGIGGLSTAIALQKKGFEVNVFEAAAELRPVGAGIIMASNAMQIAQKLGFAADLKQRGNVLHQFGIGNHRGEALQTTDVQAIERKYGEPSVSIHRANLQEVLAHHLAPNTLFLNKRLTSIAETDSKVTAFFEDGSSAESDILIGADGLRSVTRRLVFGEMPLRYSTHTCWRGIVKTRLAEPQNTLELWGKTGGKRVALIQLDAEQVYFYYTEKQAAGLKIAPENVHSYLAKGLAEFPKIYADIILQTPENQIHHDDINDLVPLSTWHKGRIMLLGDAAHATTPNLGQGGCQAIEDAWYFAEILSKYADFNLAFNTFEAKRRAKVKFVVDTSWLVGKMSNIGGFIGHRLRNFLLAATPNAISEKQFERIFKLDI